MCIYAFFHMEKALIRRPHLHGLVAVWQGFLYIVQQHPPMPLHVMLPQKFQHALPVPHWQRRLEEILAIDLLDLGVVGQGFSDEPLELG